MDAETGQTIVAIRIRNFCGLSALDMKPGKVNVLSGKNGAGKSSVLKAIKAAFAARGLPVGLIRRDTDKAEVLLDLGAIQIKRRITPAGNYVDVIRDDAKLTSPQTVLDELIGPALVFNPIQFFLAAPKERRTLMLQAVPITVSASDLEEWFGTPFALDYSRHGLDVLAEVEELIFEERAGANAVAKEHEATVAVARKEIPEGFDTAKWRVANVTDLADDIREAQDARNRVAEIGDSIKAAEHYIALKEQRKAELEKELAQVNESLASSASNIIDLQTERDAIEIPDDTEAQEALAAHSEAMAVLAYVDMLEGAQVKQATAVTEAEELTASLELARKKPAELLAAAKLPIEGLEITTDSMSLNSIPLDQLSDSEQLLLGLDIAVLLSGDLGIVCVDGAELLDDENFEVLMEQARKGKHQFFVTRVSKGDLEITNYDLETTEADDGPDA